MLHPGGTTVVTTGNDGCCLACICYTMRIALFDSRAHFHHRCHQHYCLNYLKGDGNSDGCRCCAAGHALMKMEARFVGCYAASCGVIGGSLTDCTLMNCNLPNCCSCRSFCRGTDLGFFFCCYLYSVKQMMLVNRLGRLVLLF